MIYSEKCPPAFHLTSTEGPRSSTSHEWKSTLGDPYADDSRQRHSKTLLLFIYTEKNFKILQLNLQTKPTSTVQSSLKNKLKICECELELSWWDTESTKC